MVLIFSDELDIHAIVVKKRLEQLNQEVILLSTKELTRSWSIIISENRCEIKFSDRVEDINNFIGIWHRRHQTPKIRETVVDENYRKFAIKEIDNLLHSITFYYKGNVINYPISDYEAASKAKQLKIANCCGMRVPKTLITSDDKSVLNFFKYYDKVIFKPLTSPSFQFPDTRILNAETLFKFKNSISVAPTIYQEYVEGPYHLRVTVVDSIIHSAKIISNESAAEIDWRLDPSIIISKYKIPKNLENRIIRFMKLMNLRYGAFDFKKTTSGDFVFFEVNSGGQFLFVEIETGQEISLAIANALIRK